MVCLFVFTFLSLTRLFTDTLWIHFICIRQARIFEIFFIGRIFRELVRVKFVALFLLLCFLNQIVHLVFKQITWVYPWWSSLLTLQKLGCFVDFNLIFEFICDHYYFLEVIHPFLLFVQRFSVESKWAVDGKQNENVLVGTPFINLSVEPIIQTFGNIPEKYFHFRLSKSFSSLVFPHKKGHFWNIKHKKALKMAGKFKYWHLFCMLVQKTFIVLKRQFFLIKAYRR